MPSQQDSRNQAGTDHPPPTPAPESRLGGTQHTLAPKQVEKEAPQRLPSNPVQVHQGPARDRLGAVVPEVATDQLSTQRDDIRAGLCIGIHEGQ